MTRKPTHRLKIEYVDPHTLKPWKGNPRVMSPEDHEKLKTGMREFSDIVEGGIVDPLIVRRRDNLVVGGHQRLEDVLKLGLPRVPVVFINISERRMKALNLALNKIHGDWDDDKLASILAELKDLPEATLTGFDQTEINKIIADADIPNLGATEPSAKTQGLCLVPYLGGKQKLASRLISMMPEHTSYVEVFGGGASVLLNKPRSAIEVYNDLDGWLVNLFEVIRDNPEAFLKKAEFLLYSRELFERWQKEATGGGAHPHRIRWSGRSDSGTCSDAALAGRQARGGLSLELSLEAAPSYCRTLSQRFEQSMSASCAWRLITWTFAV